MRKTLTIFMILSIAICSYAQNDAKWHIGIDMGGGGASGTINEKWNVRQSLNSYSNYDYGYYYNSENLQTDAFIFYMGIKPEYSFTDKLSIASGLRLVQIESNFTGSGSNGNYFFLRTSAANATQTEYYRIKSINEGNYYLGIPLEFKYTPFHFGHFSFYGKIGTEIGFLIQNKASIEFQLKEMQSYENEVLDKVGMKTSNLYSTFSGALGVNYHTKKGWNFNFDIYSGSSFLTENNSNLINLEAMSGVQCSIMMPIHFKKK